MVNNVITDILVVHDDYQGEYTYRFTRAIATLVNKMEMQLHAESYYGAQGELSGEWVNTKISSFLRTNRRAFQDYCHGKSVEHDPVSFMRWVDAHNYHYEDLSKVNKLQSCDVWHYHGNLKEYSSAFSFYIFDKNLAAQCRRHLQKRR